MKLKSALFCIMLCPFVAHAKIAAEMTAIFDLFKTYSILMLLAFVLCLLSLMAHYISIKWMTNKLAHKFGMGSFSAFLLIIAVVFVSYYYFHLLALMIYSLWGAHIKARAYGLPSSNYFFNDLGDNTVTNNRCESNYDSACDGDGGGD